MIKNKKIMLIEQNKWGNMSQNNCVLSGKVEQRSEKREETQD